MDKFNDVDFKKYPEEYGALKEAYLILKNDKKFMKKLNKYKESKKIIILGNEFKKSANGLFTSSSGFRVIKNVKKEYSYDSMNFPMLG